MLNSTQASTLASEHITISIQTLNHHPPLLNALMGTALAGLEGVISVFRSKLLQLHTTRSWDFMGLSLSTQQRIPLQLDYGDDIVVGIFDTGTSCLHLIHTL
ncbi:hypothetical protein GW17_00044652 [Ensete ventricosum]|nr:hypothetical protein GW17_00044652 [Ensete ventricosum]